MGIEGRFSDPAGWENEPGDLGPLGSTEGYSPGLLPRRDPITDADVAHITERNPDAAAYHDALLHMLRAPYLSSSAWAISLACALLEHPTKYPAGQEPKFNPGGCPCGKRSA